MTDIDKLTELLSSWGVPHEYTAHDGVTQISVGRHDNPYKDRGTLVDGYPGFYTCYNFDYDGKFISMGAWE